MASLEVNYWVRDNLEKVPEFVWDRLRNPSEGASLYWGETELLSDGEPTAYGDELLRHLIHITHSDKVYDDGVFPRYGGSRRGYVLEKQIRKLRDELGVDSKLWSDGRPDVKKTQHCTICDHYDYPTDAKTDCPEVDRMKKDQLCWSCAFWLIRLEEWDDSNLMIDYMVYSVGDESKGGTQFSGFGGRRFVIEKYDGTRIESTNLWCGGLVPEHFRHFAENNARFIRE